MTSTIEAVRREIAYFEQELARTTCKSRRPRHERSLEIRRARLAELERQELERSQALERAPAAAAPRQVDSFDVVWNGTKGRRGAPLSTYRGSSSLSSTAAVAPRGRIGGRL